MEASNTIEDPVSTTFGGDRRLIGLAVLLAALCVVRAVQLAWLGDDAFISFRYARNLADGLGLVYNAGEHVEGYTNLLWTLAIAGLMKLGFAPETTAHVLGIACWFALSLVLAWWSYARARREGRPFLPLAAILNLVLADIQRWATGGLETSMFSLLTATGLVLLAASAPRPARLLTVGTILALGCATRPDGVLFAAIGVAYAFGMRREAAFTMRLRDSAWVALPLVLIGAALVTFKLRYYGDLFPTAFYSKSPLAAYYSQGLLYIGLFFARNWFVVLFLAAALVLVRARAALLATRTNALFLAAFLVFTFYVAHSAGDYMYARRLLPALPFLWLLLEDLLLACPTRRIALALFAITLLAAVLPRGLYPATPLLIHGVTNEWATYPQAYRERSRARGELVGELLRATPVRGIFQGGMCMFAYYSGLPYLAEMTGLTQYSLAKKPLVKRSYIGHEKKADDAWLTANNIHLIFFHADPALIENGYRHFDLVRFGDKITAMIWKYSDAVMDPLRTHANVDFVPIESVLAQAEKDIAAASPADAGQILEFLERYYLADAPPARAPLAAHLRQMVADKQR